MIDRRPCHPEEEEVFLDKPLSIRTYRTLEAFLGFALHPQVQRCAAKALGLFTSGELSGLLLPLLISSIQSEFLIEPGKGGVHTPEGDFGVREGSSSAALCRDSMSAGKERERRREEQEKNKEDKEKNEIDAPTVHMEVEPQQEEEEGSRRKDSPRESQLHPSQLHFAQQGQIEEEARDSPSKGMQTRGRSTRHYLLLSALRQVLTQPRPVFLEILRREREEEEDEGDGEEGYMQEEEEEEEKKERGGERRQGDANGAERQRILDSIITPHIQQVESAHVEIYKDMYVRMKTYRHVWMFEDDGMYLCMSMYVCM